MMMLVLQVFLASKYRSYPGVLFMGQLMNVTRFELTLDVTCYSLLIVSYKISLFFICNLHDEILMHHCILQPEKSVEAGTIVFKSLLC